MAYGSFEDLEVWQRACSLAVDIYKVMENGRDFGLKDQMTRAAVSIASNIAEGAERGSTPDFIRFLHMSKGSAAELRTQVYIACRIQLISDQTQKQLTNELKSISKMIHALIKSLKAKNLEPKT
ncbi:MAG: four helix bundle protein [Desulfobacterales bacterium]